MTTNSADSSFRINNSSSILLSNNVSSPAYRADYDYVRLFGSRTSVNRTVDQYQLAFFWRLGAGTPTVPGFYTQIALELLRRKNINSNYETAKLLALLHVAGIDANGAGWYNKYNR